MCKGFGGGEFEDHGKVAFQQVFQAIGQRDSLLDEGSSLLGQFPPQTQDLHGFLFLPNDTDSFSVTMDTKMEAAQNPYCSPASSGSTGPKEQSGLRWLLTGMAVFLACLLVSGYFVVMEIPFVLADFDRRNVQLPEDLLVVNRAAPFILKYWYIFVLAVLALFLVTEWRFAGGTKRRIRRWIGVGIGITSMTFTFWLAWATLSRAGWQLLYSY